MVLLYTWYIEASLNSCGVIKQRKFPKINVSDYQMHKKQKVSYPLLKYCKISTGFSKTTFKREKVNILF